MPPKAKISKEMIVNAALEIARLTGAENINARTVSQKLNCSTQPIMYHFKTIEDLKKATYQKADEYHTTYLSRIEGDNPMLGIGMAYIRFAADEPLLFRFLFQSNSFSGKSIVISISFDGPERRAFKPRKPFKCSLLYEFIIFLIVSISSVGKVPSRRLFKVSLEI